MRSTQNLLGLVRDSQESLSNKGRCESLLIQDKTYSFRLENLRISSLVAKERQQDKGPTIGDGLQDRIPSSVRNEADAVEVSCNYTLKKNAPSSSSWGNQGSRRTFDGRGMCAGSDTSNLTMNRRPDSCEKATMKADKEVDGMSAALAIVPKDTSTNGTAAFTCHPYKGVTMLPTH